ncbi:hypothetical protein chiPu_0025674, partial [Chiloscyllium punctatum]|nr:hypothetical protein [Chiloscyllium punctatum]
MAARVKGGRLVLKSFKDIPLENLESLLPAVRVHLPLRDRTLLYASLLVGGTALFANLAVLGLHSLRVDFALVLGLFAVLMGYRRHRLFEQRREQHALEHAVTLYTKSTSNNGETILALVQRAQQEHVKEILLAHSFG